MEFVATLAVLAMVGAWIASGIPLSWVKGTVVPGSCVRVSEGVDCRVELVPDGSQVTVHSDVALRDGTWVEIRVWRLRRSGPEIYSLVH